jgi:hypothetical protein
MARGDSGRIVLEIDPAEKEELYSAVTKDGLTLKNWFLQQMTNYLGQRARSRSSSSIVAEGLGEYRSSAKRKSQVPSEKKRKNRNQKAT